MSHDGTVAPDGLMDAFWSYEKALMGNDLDALVRLFAPGPDTLRGAPGRRIVETHVQEVDPDHALVVAVTELDRGGRGQQMQLWARGGDGWQVTAAHVAVPAAAFDPRIWRIVGDPLLPGSGTGPLTGESVAVKDLYAVAGQRVGAGNPAWLDQAAVETTTAWAVQQLLDAGADVAGIARTDEFAYSLAGTNAQYGTPPNPKAPRRISGGSSSGSSSAVSLGHASIGLGTDTGGSIRVPAAYQGLWGIRTTHGLLSTDGLLPLAPSYDAVGWLARSPELLARVGEVLLPEGPGGSDELVVVPALLDQAEPDVAAAVTGWLEVRATTTEDHDVAQLPDWLAAFQTLQAWEAWRQHGPWLEGRLDTLGDDVRSRFETGSQVTEAQAEKARAAVAAARSKIRDLVGDRVLVLPSASSVAPRIGPGLAERLQQVRTATMQLTCLAGLGGLPAVSVPVETSDGLPAGVCLVAAPGRDRDLLALARRRN